MCHLSFFHRDVRQKKNKQKKKDVSFLLWSIDCFCGQLCGLQVKRLGVSLKVCDMPPMLSSTFFAATAKH